MGHDHSRDQTCYSGGPSAGLDESRVRHNSAGSERTVGGPALARRRGRTTARCARNAGRLGAAATTGRALARTVIVVFMLGVQTVGRDAICAESCGGNALA